MLLTSIRKISERRTTSMEYIQQSIFDFTEFDDIKHLSKNGAEFWYARELSKLLQYTEYNTFEKVI